MCTHTERGGRERVYMVYVYSKCKMWPLWGIFSPVQDLGKMRLEGRGCSRQVRVCVGRFRVVGGLVCTEACVSARACDSFKT